MKTIKRTVEVTEFRLGTLHDCLEFVEWATGMEGVAVAVFAPALGDVMVQAEGTVIDTVRAGLGDTVFWDGERFTVQHPEPQPEEPEEPADQPIEGEIVE